MRLASDNTVGSEVSMLVTQRPGYSWVPLSGGYDCFWSVARTTDGSPASGAWTCFLKATLPGLGLHWAFATFYLDSKISTKTLYSMDSSQIFGVFFGGTLAGDLLFYYLADVNTSIFLKLQEIFFYFPLFQSSDVLFLLLFLLPLYISSFLFSFSGTPIRHRC